jgi:iron complex transport system ATP-binding protein
MRLRTAGLTIARGGRVLLAGVDAEFSGGETVAVLGANGVGKTSLLHALAGLLRPQRGSILIDDRSISSYSARARALRIALVDATEPVVGTVTVGETVASARFAHHRWWDWQATPADRAAIETALERLDLQGVRHREQRTLYAGERQRVWLAVAVAQRADIILLDEPTSHLDLRYAVETLELIRALARDGALVIAVLHLLEEAAAFCERVVLLGAGGIIAAGPPHVALTSASVARAYGIAIDVECRADGLFFARRRKIIGTT